MDAAATIEPVTEDDGLIESALGEANVPTLMMSLVHLTGDTSLLEGPIRPVAVTMGDPQGGLSEESKTEIRRRALEALRDYRRRGGTMPPPPPRETLHRMMSFMVGAPVSKEYVPMFAEEICLAGENTRSFHWTNGAPVERLGRFRVLVIGAGMSGVLAAIRLGQAGIPYVVIEKNSSVGGTWFENAYPGCRVDIPNHFYSYSFEPNHDWPEHFSTQRELFSYFADCAERYGVTKHVRFDTEVVSAVWDETSCRW
ncbi:MAG: NAD(P)-binding protein [Candidatus Binatia bacterium]